MWKLGGEIGNINSTRQNFIPPIVCGFPRSEQRRIMTLIWSKQTDGIRVCNNTVIASLFLTLRW